MPPGQPPLPGGCFCKKYFIRRTIISLSETIWNTINDFSDLLYRGGWRGEQPECPPIRLPQKTENSVISQNLPKAAERIPFVLNYHGSEQPKILVLCMGSTQGAGLFSPEVTDFAKKMFNAIELDMDKELGFLDILPNPPQVISKSTLQHIASHKEEIHRAISGHNPKAILGYSSFPAQIVLGTEVKLEVMRGQVYRIGAYPFIPTYDPRQVLKNSSLKRPAWEDLKRLRGVLDYG